MWLEVIPSSVCSPSLDISLIPALAVIVSIDGSIASQIEDSVPIGRKGLIKMQ
jgi:hypothetical protein